MNQATELLFLVKGEAIQSKEMAMSAMYRSSNTRGVVPNVSGKAARAHQTMSCCASRRIAQHDGCKDRIYIEVSIARSS